MWGVEQDKGWWEWRSLCIMMLINDVVCYILLYIDDVCFIMMNANDNV